MSPIRERRVRPHYPPSLLRQRFDEELVLMPGGSLLCNEYEQGSEPSYEPEPRKSVRFSPIKYPATAVPIPSQLAPAFSGIPPVEQLAAVRGKTPPVARSPSPASRKSPRSTPSETPARAFSKSMSPLTDDDEADDNDGDDSLIPKPSGQCGRLKRDGYSLEETLQWGEDYEKIYEFVKQIALRTLEKSLPVSKQSLQAMRTVYYLASKEYPRLLKYKDDWPTRDIITTVWSNVRKKGKALVQPARALAGTSRRSTPVTR